MIPLPARSPFDGGRIVVTRFFCPDTNLTVEGEFEVLMPFSQLSSDQLKFVEIFVRNEGRLNRMEGELGLSYPTVRSRLHDIIRALGYEPGKDETQAPPAPAVPTIPPAAPPAPSLDRRQVLEDLEAGRIGFDQAMALLQGEL
ncbi:MAG: DUF2089 domain-containing protein [Caldilineaceae bacterium]